MPNAKRPAGPTKPTHLVRENAIEREQIDEALGIPDAAEEALQEPSADAGTGPAAGERPNRAPTDERSRPR
jgi:hypothetical protein